MLVLLPENERHLLRLVSQIGLAARDLAGYKQRLGRECHQAACLSATIALVASLCWMKPVAFILKTNLPTLLSFWRASADLFLSALPTSSCTEHKRGHEALAIISSWAGEVSCPYPGLELKLLSPCTLQLVKGVTKSQKSHVALNRQNVSFHLIRPVPRWNLGGKQHHIAGTERIYLTAINPFWRGKELIKVICIPGSEGKRRISWRGM